MKVAIAAQSKIDAQPIHGGFETASVDQVPGGVFANQKLPSIWSQRVGQLAGWISKQLKW